MQGSGFRDQGSGFRVQGAGFRVQGSGFRKLTALIRVLGCGGMKRKSTASSSWLERESEREGGRESERASERSERESHATFTPP